MSPVSRAPVGLDIVKVVNLVSVLLVLAAFTARGAFAQGMAGMDHDQMQMASGWTFMQDGTVFVMLNDQGSPRGGSEVRAPNWWMGMFEHQLGGGTLTLTTMISLDPATVGSHGYGEIFQIGETYHGEPLFDRQHPHDLLMQAAAVWRAPIGHGVSLTLAGAPVGEPALGPIAYMHRSSAAEIPMAPLGHHTLDSTHISMGVVTAGIDRGRWQVEGSIFNGREPDENRWDLMDPGPLDSWSARVWYRPTPEWTLQASHGYLTSPEALEPGDVRRTTASIGWKRAAGDAGWTSVTVAWGMNQKATGLYEAYLGEITRQYGWGAVFGRAEMTQLETDVLLGMPVTAIGPRDFVGSFTGGATKTLWTPRGWNVAVTGEIVGYAVPGDLTSTYGSHPWSEQLVVRIRPPAAHRMRDVTMTRHAM
jgi:hypothetical protein